MTPSRRSAESASNFAAMRSAVALSVVLAHLVRRLPVWSNHWTYQKPPRFPLPPRLKTLAIFAPAFPSRILPRLGAASKSICPSPLLVDECCQVRWIVAHAAADPDAANVAGCGQGPELAFANRQRSRRLFGFQ